MNESKRRLVPLIVAVCAAWLLFSQAVVMAANLMVDGGFEAQPLQWQVINSASGSWSYDTSTRKEGSRSMCLTPTDSSYPHFLALQQYYDTLEGPYYFEGYGRIDELYNGAHMPRVEVNIVPRTPGAFEPTYETFSMPPNAAPNTWVKLRGNFQVPAGARVFIQLFADGELTMGSAGNAWFDALVLSKYDAPNRPRKKLIHYGAAAPDTRYVRQYWRQMEKMPLDGIGITVAIDRALPSTGNGASANLLGWNVFGPAAFQLSAFQPAIDDLKSAQWRNFTDNFLPVAIASYDQDQGFQWFDDARWNTILNNWCVLVSIAKQGGCKGLIFDPEQYDYSGKGAELFNFKEQFGERDNTHDFAAYKAKVRERGRQLMIASGQLFPDMTLLCTYAYYPASLEGTIPETDRRYSLLASFMDGMLEGSHARTKWVDMCEQGYGYKERQQFIDAAEYTRNTLDDYSSIPETYRTRMHIGFALWLDKGSNSWNTVDYNQNYFTPEIFGQAVQNAMEVSDEYVWIYTQTPTFFPLENLPDDYLKHLRNSRYAAGAGQNIIRNGSFEWDMQYWDIINPTRGHQEIVSDGVMGVKSTCLEPLNSSYPAYYVFQQYSDTLKSQYFFEGYVRIDESYNGVKRPRVCLNIYPKIAGEFSPVIETFEMPADAAAGTWVRIGGQVDVPPNARIWSQLFVTGTGGHAWFDGISLR